MNKESTFSRKNIANILSLTPMQEGMLFHYLRSPKSGRYHEQLSLTLAGAMDIPRFKNAWREVTAANEMLRTLFRWEWVKNPLQMVLKQHEPKIRIHDLRRSNPGEKHRTLRDIRDTDRETPFDLTAVPFRVTLCLLDDDRHEMIIGNHHIIYDGWSTGIILQEFFEAYHREGDETPVKPAKPSFQAYIKWLNQQDKDAQARYWEAYLLDGGIAKTGADKPAPAKAKGDIGVTGAYRLHIDAGKKQRLEAFAGSRRVTLASVLYSAWGLLMQSYFAAPDIVFDTTVSGRAPGITPGIDHMVGLFINTVPLRVRTQTGDTLESLVQRIAHDQQQREAFESTSVAVIKDYMERAACAGFCLFDSVLVLENYPLDQRLMRDGRDGEGLRTVFFNAAGESSYDLTVLISIFDALDISITYNAELFDQELMAWLGSHFTLLLEAFIESPDRDISTLNGIPAAEKLQLIDRLQHRRALDAGMWQAPEYAAPRDDVETLLVEIWQEVLQRTPVGIDDNFFDFGGHSLKATLLLSRIHQAFEKKIPIAEFFLNATIRELAEFITGTPHQQYTAITPAAVSEYYSLSSAQTRWYFLQQLEPESVAYNGPLAMRLEGEMTPHRRDTIENTFQTLIRRHEILRTSFVEIKGKPYQEVHGAPTFKLVNRIGATGHSGETPDIGDYPGIINAFIRPFDLSRAPLLRAELVRLDDRGTSHLLLVDMHHMVTDGFSLEIFIREFNLLYRGQSLSPPVLQYKDFSHWQQDRLASGELKQQERYWLGQFPGPPPVLNLPTDFPRPPRRSHAGDIVSFSLNRELMEAVHRLQQRTGATLFMVLLSAFYILLSKYSGQDDIVIGATTAGRNHADLRDLMGLLLETLALRNEPAAEKPLERFLEEVRERTLKAFENQDYPFGELMKRVGDDRDLGRNPLFDVMLIVQNMGTAVVEMDGFTVTPVPYKSAVAKLDLTLEALESPDGVNLTLEYCTALFRRDTMERFTRHYINILRVMTADHKPGGLRLGDIAYLDEAEQRMLLEELNDTARPFPEERTVHRLFEEQTDRTPDRIVVSASSADTVVSVTYRELNDRSDRLAALLVEKGVMPDSIVGIYVEPSVDMMTGLLGILKAGGAYLPLDPDYPPERLKYMTADSNVKIVVTNDNELSKVSELSEDREIIHLNGLDDAAQGFPTQHSTPNTQHLSSLASAGTPGLAYVIYTSGSTGKPKGVAVEHGNLTAYIHSFYREFDLGPRDIVLQQASYAFDVFVEEVYPVLLRGGRIAAPGRERVKDIDQLAAFIARQGVTVVDCSPLMLRGLNQQDPALSASVRIFINGGDVLKPEYIDNLVKIGAVYNTYGPTESTVCATYYRCVEPLPADIPIGGPIANYRVYVLDREQRPVPVGVPGELCVAGPGVTRGYLNRPELTAERFITLNKSHKSHGSYRTYLTGDRVKWRPDSPAGGAAVIQFLGRIDHQVKIRGYRIEPGEIESRLTAHPHIREAVVLPKENPEGGKYLCAYITVDASRPTELTAPEIRAHIVEKLPDYMAPALFIPVERMPLTPTGKPDRGALPEPGRNLIPSGREYIPPSTAVEEALVKIWRELLPVDRIGVTDDFFELGGDSILVNRCIAGIRETLHVDISMRIFFEQPVIKSLALKISGHGGDAASPRPMKREGEIPLSFAQERLWFLQELDADNASYFVPRVIRMKGPLDVTLLERTFTEIIRRHEILRTAFPTVDGRAVQRVGEPYYFKIPTIDWSREKDSSEKVSHFLEAEGRKVFDFEKGPLLRVTVLKIGDEEHLLVLTEHHLIHDGWTQGVLLKEFIAVFSALREGRRHSLDELPIQYADFAIWQREYIQGEVLERHLDYWKEKLAGLPPLLELPVDRPRPAEISGGGGLIILHLSHALTDALKTYGKEKGATLFMTMLTAFKTFLYRYSGVEDLCVGTGIANRRYKEMEGMLGMVINTLALRTQISGDWSFNRCLQEVRKTCLEAYEHEDTPFGNVVEVMRSERSLSYTPIFQVLFGFMDTPTGDLWLPGLQLHLEESHNRSSKFDINVVVVPPQEPGDDDGAADREERIIVEWEYNTDIFDDATAQRHVDHYVRLLEEAVKDSGVAVVSMPMLTDSQLRELLYQWNETETDYPRRRTIDALFEEQVEREGSRAAVLGAGSISYEALNQMADQLASRLVSKGVAPDTIIGLMTDRSVEMIIGILGILKAGGAYLPIDPGHPDGRIRYMLTESGAPLLVAQKHHSGRELNFHHETIDISDESIFAGPAVSPPKIHTADHLAYVIYTSGTTGKPKGVAAMHHNVVRVVKDTNYIDITAGDRLLQLSNYAFDGSVFDIYGALLNGAGLVLVKKEDVFAVDRLHEIITEYRVTVFFVTTALFNTLVDIEPGFFTRIRKVLFGGERVSLDHAERALEYAGKGKIIHVYGPTETTVYAAFHPIDEIPESAATVPIGKALANTRLYILDKYLKPVPVGASGFLYIGGDGGARGYLNNPELTAERFIKNPFAAGDRLYFSGDIARFLPDGGVEFIGRADHQVKIRGFRIELEEIETQLLSLPEIDQAVVEVHGEGKAKSLCAYIVTASAPDVAELKKRLAQGLPDYMIPAHFVFLDRIPLNPNGKVDRKRLPAPDGMETTETYTAADGETEQRLVAIWAEVLGVDREKLSTTAGFFELGGHSLNAVLLVSRMHKALNVKIPLAEFFKRGCIREVGQYIEAASEEIFTAVQPAETMDFYPLSPAQKRLYFLYKMDEQSTAYNIPTILALEGRIDKQRLENVFASLIERHESLRTSFHIIENEPVQKIQDDVTFSLTPYPLSLISDFVRPFDVSEAPLMRVGLIEEAEGKHLLMVDMHHIITDGTSMSVFIKDFIAFYRGETLPPPRIHYKDYSEWLHRERTGERFQSHRQYWLEQYRDAPPALELPVDFPRPVMRSFAGRTYRFHIDADDSTALDEFASARGVTLYTVLLTLYNVFIAKLSGQQDIVVGTPVAGRDHADLEPLIGMFVNTLALRNRPEGDKSFITFLNEVNQNTLEAFAHQAYQYEELVEQVVEERDTGRNPLFDTMLLLKPIDITEVEIPGLKLSPYPYEEKVSKFDLTLRAYQATDALQFTFEYCTALFTADTIERFARLFRNLVSRVVAAPHVALSGISLISEDEKQQIMAEFNGAAVDYPRDKTIHQLFEEQAAKAGDDIALVAHGARSTEHGVEATRVTYRELNRKADDSASILMSKGVVSGDIVAIMGERSIDMAKGILGILKTGSAYLPIDIDYPEERKRYLLADSNVKIMLTEGENPFSQVSELSRDIEIIHLDELHKVPGDSHTLHSTPNTQHLSSSPAYIMYTSGSTGRPKGVMVTHRNVVRLVKNNSFVPLSEETCMLQTGAPVFDAVTFEMWGALLNGGRLVLAGKEVILDAHRLGGAMEAYGVNTLWLSASLFNRLVQENIELFTPLNYLLVGGDILSPPHINRVRERFPRLNVINGYGPTENTTFSTTHLIHKTYEHDIPIGRPISNSTAYIVDAAGAPQPVGVWGELLVGGDGVALGYLNNPELTVERFWGGAAPSLNKTHKSYRTYRTGDLARYLPDGVIQFKGRIDQQVKIRGFRIELGEIEQQLLSHEAVKETVVIAREERGDKQLCAYVAPQNGAPPGPAVLRAFLAAQLPAYMIPTHFIFLERIPLTPGGKVDRNRLPGPDSDADTGAVYVAPENDREKIIAGIWGEMLGVESVGRDHNFFELGGTSLDIIKVCSRLKTVLEIDVPVAVLFRFPTVRLLAAGLDDNGNTGLRPRHKKKDPHLTEKTKNRRQQRRESRAGRRGDR